MFKWLGPAVIGNRVCRFKQRKLWFRLGAIIIGVSPFLLAELILIVTGWQPPGAVNDPFIGFTEIRPLFVVDESGTKYVVSPARMPLFCADEFLVEKPANEFRIFCVGGSTVQGRPFAIETAFSTWLELRLKSSGKLASSPKTSTDWNVVNCGGVSYASYRLAPIVDEIVNNYHPDLIVLYTGHNEFLEDRTYESVKSTPRWISRTHERLSSLRTYSFLRSLVVADASTESPSEILPVDVEARLDFRYGLEQYHRDDDWKQNVTSHFEHNLRRMVSTIQDGNVPLILCNPVANLRDAPPFKSQHSDRLSNQQIKQFDYVLDSLAAATHNVDLNDTKTQLEKLVGDNARYADMQYFLGKILLQLGEFEQAKQHLILAKEEDVCPLRMIEPMYDSIAKVAKERDVAMVDVKAFFKRRAPDGIPGRESLIDHVHPTIYGHQLISKWLMDEMVQMQLVVRRGQLENETALFEPHLASLPYIYFEHGKDRLAGLKRWAEGRVTKE